jgi:hypothetical protein
MYSMLICIGTIVGTCQEWRQVNYPSREDCISEKNYIQRQINKNGGFIVCRPEEINKNK